MKMSRASPLSPKTRNSNFNNQVSHYSSTHAEFFGVIEHVGRVAGSHAFLKVDLAVVGRFHD